MARSRSSIGFFGIFGRSEDLRRLDTALRAAGLHPALVPESVKLTTVNLMKDRSGGEPPPQAYQPAADLLALCVLGEAGFAEATSPQRRAAAEARLARAVAAGEGADAELVLLTLHAGLADADLVARHGLSAEDD
ncbi:hypothetical protein N1F89_19210 [Aquibium sp. A9E412]|uniref:hypothetical protein n=1 Tax=Aquibium sp. A9E412 TaxID=2976767 RepID=UPI0025AF4837|nr:hypothetical protein [Aquibium sp. A9E412]MDN2568359.1 hypothetical protein [Aquibium sp. A9E412]